jgi:putative glutamine amidotransferase
MTIAVADNMGSERKLQLYFEWLLRCEPSVKCMTLSYKFDNIDALKNSDGLLLTGGGDVDPHLYNQSGTHPTVRGVDRARDDFERKIINQAMKYELPLLGICRGLQIANVHFGGSLIPDIEEAGYKSHRSQDGQDSRHGIKIGSQSLLARLAGISQSNVNSSHHQAVAVPGSGLKIVAHSDDGIVEALECEETDGKPFFLLVQWHPERMEDFDNTLSKNILSEFLLSMKSKENITENKRSKT